MKKLLFFISFLFFAAISVAQIQRPNPMPGFQPFGSPTTLTRINGILYPQIGYAPALWTDTAAANANSYIKTVPLAQISTADGKTWRRNYGCTKWEEFAIGSGSTPTLQQVYNTQPGGAILTKEDTIIHNAQRGQTWYWDRGTDGKYNQEFYNYGVVYRHYGQYKAGCTTCGLNTMNIEWIQNAAYPAGVDTIINGMGAHNGPDDKHFYLADQTDSYAGPGIPANRLLSVEKNGSSYTSFYNNPANNNAQVLIGFYAAWAVANYEWYRLVVGGRSVYNGIARFLDTVDVQSANFLAPNLAAGVGTKAVRWDGATGKLLLADTSSGGSGTLNYIPKWTPSGTALGNSIIYDNGTNVGIGTASPSFKLDIIAGMRINDANTGEANGANGLRIITTGAGLGAGVQMGNATTGSTNVWQFFSKGSTLDFSIGRANVQDNILMGGTSGAPKTYFPGPNGGATMPAGNFTLLADAGTNAAFVPIVAKLNASQTADAFQVQNSAGTALTVINSSGSVGIGTASTVSILDVYKVGSGASSKGATFRDNVTPTYAANADNLLTVRGTGVSTATWRGRITSGGDNVSFLMGEYNSQAWLGAHNAAMNAWASLYINPDGGQDVYIGNTGGLGNMLLTISNSTASVRTRGNTYLAEVTGALTVGTTNAIVGTATNNNATAGHIGEEIKSTVSTYTNYTTTATYQCIDSVTLTAGDWDLSAFFTYSSNSATITAASNAIFVISTTIASASGAIEGLNISYVPQAALLGTSKFTDVINPFRVSLASTTKYYLNTQATFTVGNPQFVGTIRARRMR